ncbi:HAMP domain-containing sensor histidine kinase [uncultured Sphingomonas sp.]|uniref:sensor histidine kinase n=1 Tax=uncultured Sphingomonas sp. TaxID=158754 RepID=UPI0025ED351E|nr:HAMP domain-containing sensor histidine kinase [uncultured Sphingomonas sp.]
MIRALWTRPSALTAIGGFSVAIAVLSVVITASIVLLMPDPPAVRMSVAEAAQALRGGETKLERSIGPAPEGSSAKLLQPVLARMLGRPPENVRVVWANDSKLPDGGMIVFTASKGAGVPPPKLIWPGGTPPKGAVVIRRSGTLPTRMIGSTWSNPIVTDLLQALPQPAFVAGVRLADGRWLTVAPRSPIFAGWRMKGLAALAACLAVLAPLVWLFARRLTRPFRALAVAIDAGDDPPQAQGPRELQEAAGAIVQLRTRLAAEADERMRMLTAVAHDLRTPLTSLRLRIESAPEPQRSRMIADADRMQAMIADVLDYARIATAPRQTVALRALIADILADLPQVTLMDGAEPTVVAIEPALRRALENLIRNAIDYAGGGRIELARDGGRAVVRVIDAGPGIPAEDRARLLRPFERGDASRNRDTGGVGLGLSIVQNVAAQHGGTLTLTDAPGGGTIATLRLPVS